MNPSEKGDEKKRSKINAPNQYWNRTQWRRQRKQTFQPEQKNSRLNLAAGEEILCPMLNLARKDHDGNGNLICLICLILLDCFLSSVVKKLILF